MSKTAGPLGRLVPCPGRIAPTDAEWLSEQAQRRNQTIAEFVHTLVSRAGGTTKGTVTVTERGPDTVTVTDQIDRDSQSRREREEPT